MMREHVDVSTACRYVCWSSGGASGSPLMFGSSVGWGGVWGGKSSPQTPSPPSQLSRSAPMAPVFSASSVDEGIVLDETKSFFLGAGSGTREKEVRTVVSLFFLGAGSGSREE